MRKGLLFCIAVLALVAGFTLKTKTDTPNPAVPQTNRTLAAHFAGLEASVGKPHAPLTIVMYYSLTCPHCHDFHENVLPKIKEQYIDKGLVQFIFRDFPTDNLALQAAKVAWCKGHEPYLTAAKELLATQENWIPQDPEKYAEAQQALKEVAIKLGIEEEKYEKCINSKETEDIILRTSFEAQHIHLINAAPAFMINGRVIEGILTPEIIQDHLLQLGIHGD